MKQDSTTIRLTIVLVTFVSLLSSQEDNGTAAVLDLVPRGITEKQSGVLTKIFRKNIADIGKVELIDREKMIQLLATEGTLPSWCAAEWCAVEVGRLLSTEKAVAGYVEKEGTRFSLGGILVASESGDVISTTTIEFVGEMESLLTEVKVLAYQLFETALPPDLQSKHDEIMRHSEDLQGITAARKRTTAVIRSAIFPGLGQLYLEKKLLGFGFLATQMALGGAIYSEYSTYKTSYDETDNFYQLYQEETNVDSILQYKDDAKVSFRQAETAIQQRKTFTNVALIFWLGNIYHAYRSVTIPDTAESKSPLLKLYFDHRAGGVGLGVAIALD
ncbi:MAG: DUF5683 domain-containing protein [Candidatus Marinimicrobia bacterium]|nr:DUF5683 domain-containing protein [Candidatus Neomarinimicrobiota bacterium]